MLAPHMSAECVVTQIETTDIGGTNVASAYLPMAEFMHVFARVEIGTWNASDDLDECRLEQATDVNGGSVKDLTTDASGGNYDTDNPVDADGDFVILEAKAEDLDVANGFTHVRLYLAEGGNSGVDNVTAVVIRCCAKNGRKQLAGAAVTGSKVYVRPS